MAQKIELFRITDSLEVVWNTKKIIRNRIGILIEISSISHEKNIRTKKNSCILNKPITIYGLKACLMSAKSLAMAYSLQVTNS